MLEEIEEGMARRKLNIDTRIVTSRSVAESILETIVSENADLALLNWDGSVDTKGFVFGRKIDAAVDPRAIRTRAKLAQAQMAPLMGMSLSGYRREQGQRRVSGPAATLLRVIAKEPAAVRRALTG